MIITFNVVTNYCEGSPCSHLCLLSATSPTNYTCACPEGSSLLGDGVSCSEVTNVTIAPPQRGIIISYIDSPVALYYLSNNIIIQCSIQRS